MGGLSGVFKAGGGVKGPLDAVGGRGPTKLKEHYRGVHKATWEPQAPSAAQQDTGGPSGPVIGAMSEEEQEEIRKRRAQRNRPQTTALTTGQSDTLGG